MITSHVAAADIIQERSASGPVPTQTFAQLSSDEWRVFLKYCHQTTAPAGTLVSARGADQDCLYLIQAGSLVETAAAKETPADEPVRFTAGQIVGETAFLDGAPRNAQLTADSYTELLCLRFWQFENMLQEHPRIAGKLALALARVVSSRQRPLPGPAAKTETRPAPLIVSRPVSDLLWA